MSFELRNVKLTLELPKHYDFESNSDLVQLTYYSLIILIINEYNY